MKKYQKYFVVDTNVILDNVENLKMLSDNKQNCIVLPQQVLFEIDKYKQGNDEINFQARAFNRMLANADIVVNSSYGLEVETNEIAFCIIPKHYDEIFETADDEIIESAIYWAKQNQIENLEFVSNDIVFRTLVFLKNYIAKPFFAGNQTDDKLELFAHLYSTEVIPNKDWLSYNELVNFVEGLPDKASAVEVIDGNGKPQFFIRKNKNEFVKLDDRSKINLFGVKPLNLEQQIFIEQCLNMDNDILVVNAPAGSGKTLLALVASMKLFQQGKIDKIIYVRKTIISGDKFDEIGFLPGSAMEKLYGYLLPLKDNLEFIVKAKNKKKKFWSQDELNEEIENLENKFNIEYIYEGHLRGRTLSKKSYIIWDEVQNETLATMKTLLSRVPDGSRVIAIGSLNQIDHPYLTKYNNALAFLLNQVGTFDGIQIQGCQLTKVYRGKIPNWIEQLDI